MTLTFVAVCTEFAVSILNGLVLLYHYGLKSTNEIQKYQILFGVLLLVNTSITLYINTNPVTWCGEWYLQGISFNLAEAVIDWIFLIRVYKLEQTSWKKYSWMALYWGLDVIPRIVSILMYSTSTVNDLCALYLPQNARIIKSAMNTAFVGIVGIYFIFMMIESIRQSNFQDTSEKLESLTLTSTMFGVALCIVRTVTYIPYILNTWPTITGILIPLEMTILPPLLFCSIVYGAKLKTKKHTLTNFVSSKISKEKTASSIGQQKSLSII
ncbi:hypothetical protein HK103_003084 [Boothiomyces macroporosus]|uniref:Uncharacterized protein n=1 Tax=Boothiomyces macroporosus TaxID=261099 RepID=A0AAD5Y6J0_9FUNG|nr:hypothetical protein HK103_003084 [Boothiomyces macroporosus]